ncbi:unnamed protein product [Ceutorhynchus assimilis]|uniref:Uncharacterized protein n=1 Tax=Ceutorhynchus assimilis TaxID=467358 RepID=A0A9N9N040_9CUCU|nr:unnamed protein product [Ceutorhynchus assimilis]
MSIANNEDFKQIYENLEEKSKTLCTELEERLIIITATVKSLKTDISLEKQLWKEEIQKTIDLEKKISKHNHGDYIETILTKALKKNNDKIQNEIVYKQQLLEAENMCNLEMLKIKNSLECLAPLQAIVEEWNYCDK